MNTLSYKGFIGTVNFSEKDSALGSSTKRNEYE